MADAPATLEERIGASLDKIEPTPKEEKKEAPKPETKAEEKTVADPALETAADDDTPAEEETEEGAEAEDEKEKEEEEESVEEEDDDDEKLTPEFKAALAKQRIDFKLLEGLSKKEKNVVFEHAKRLNQAFTRAQMEATTFRKEKAVLDSERAYQTKNPDRFIADLITKDPDLLDRVNKELDRRQNPIYAEALEKDRAADRKLAEVEAQQSESKHEELQERIATLEASTSRAAKEAGLPDDFAQEAVANAILQKRVKGEEANLTDAEISDIIADRTAVFNKHVGARKAASTRQAKNDYVKDKAKDAKGTKPGKPKGSSTERKTVAAGAAPENVADFANRWLDANGL